MPGEPGPGDAGAGEYIGELASWRFDFKIMNFFMIVLISFFFELIHGV